MKFDVGRDDVEVFLVAFSLLFLETVFFKTTVFIHDYLNAILVISYALLGLGIGALISYYYRDLPEDSVATLKILLMLSIVLSFINFVYFPMNLFLSPALISPFVFGSIIIAYFLKKSGSHRIYFFDLCGATLGVFSSVFFIPMLREENCFIFILLVLAISSSIYRYRNTIFKLFFCLFCCLVFASPAL